MLGLVVLALAAMACGSSETSSGSGAGGSGGVAGVTDAGSEPDADAGSEPDADSGPSDDDAGPDAAAPDAGPDAGWPATGPCFGIAVIELGQLPFDGTMTMSSGFGEDNMLIGTIVAPTSGAGTANASLYEYATPPAWRQVWLSEHRCDMTATGPPAFAQSLDPVIYFTIGGNDPSQLNLVPGKTYYLMVRNRLLTGLPSCTAYPTCDVAISVYPPG
jgi:hypothetical protein